jgi:hypothetical protein
MNARAGRWGVKVSSLGSERVWDAPCGGGGLVQRSSNKLGVKWDRRDKYGVPGIAPLHFCHYNFVRIHSTTRNTPAVEAGITDHVWDIKEILSCTP